MEEAIANSTVETGVAQGIPVEAVEIVVERRRPCRPGAALLLLFEGANNVSHVTQPTLAQFQYVCWKLAHQLAVPCPLRLLTPHEMLRSDLCALSIKVKCYAVILARFQPKQNATQ